MKLGPAVVGSPVADDGETRKVELLADEFDSITDVDIQRRENRRTTLADILGDRSFAAGRTVLSINESKVEFDRLPKSYIRSLFEWSLRFLNSPHAILIYTGNAVVLERIHIVTLRACPAYEGDTDVELLVAVWDDHRFTMLDQSPYAGIDIETSVPTSHGSGTLKLAPVDENVRRLATSFHWRSSAFLPLTTACKLLIITYAGACGSSLLNDI
jgi:hypothetical protein